MEIHLCKTLLPYTISKWGLVVQFAYWPWGGGHLGIFWVGMCRLELQIGTPFYKNFPQNWYPVLEMGQFFILRFRVQQEYNSSLVNPLNRIFKSDLSLISNGCLQDWSFREFEILYPVLENASEMDTSL